MKPELQAEIESAMSFFDGRGWCSAAKALKLAELITDNSLEIIVEIGIFGGRSFIPMGMAVRSHGKGACYGFDPMDTQAATEGGVSIENDEWWAKVDLEDMYRWFIQSLLHFQLTNECRFMRIRGETAWRLFEVESINLLHLDSNHSETVSCRDVAMWRSRVAPSGFLVMDDCNWPSQQKAIALIKQSGFKHLGDLPNGPPGSGCEYAIFQKS